MGRRALDGPESRLGGGCKLNSAHIMSGSDQGKPLQHQRPIA